MWATAAVSSGLPGMWALDKHYKPLVINVAEILMSEWFLITPLGVCVVGVGGGVLGHLVCAALFYFN